MCDGRPLDSPLFRRLAGRGAFFCGFPFRWVLHFVLNLTRSVTLHDCDFSLLAQENQSAKGFDLTCSKTFLFRDATCLPVGRSDSSRPSLPPDVPSGEQQRT